MYCLQENEKMSQHSDCKVKSRAYRALGHTCKVVEELLQSFQKQLSAELYQGGRTR